MTRSTISSLRLVVWPVLLALAVSPAWAVRIKDVAQVEGARDNQLIGYGLVVGLAGDGDSNAETTLRSVANVLQRHGLNVDSSQVKAKNAAAVMITADIGPFLKPGARIDVTISSLGDAKTLQGGVLLQTPLVGADGLVYAVAQGAIAVGGFLGGAGGAGGSTVQKNHPTVGSISNGAIVEREIPMEIVHENTLRLQLYNPDFTSASRLVTAINREYPGAAYAEDAATIAVLVPDDFFKQDVAFVSALGMLDVTPDSPARIVINERTGTIVATATVRLSHVAISHGALTITVASTLGVSQPNPLSRGGATAVVPSTNTGVTETQGGFTVLPEEPSIERLAAALNALGVSTREMMAIFQTLKRAGALQAELIIN